MKAVILAAGRGNRLRPLTNSIPKCLLRINDRTILEHQISNLFHYGIKNVVIVVGYKINAVISALDKLKEKYCELSIVFVKNHMYHKTNTLYSLWLASDHVRCDDFIYINGDVVFSKKILESLLNSPYDACLAVEKKQVGKEEVKVIVTQNIIKRIGKDLDPSKSYGEFIGIAKFSKNFNKLFIRKLDSLVKQKFVNEFFEKALDELARIVSIHIVDITGLPCVEVDTLEDYETAKKIYNSYLRQEE